MCSDKNFFFCGTIRERILELHVIVSTQKVDSKPFFVSKFAIINYSVPVSVIFKKEFYCTVLI